MPRRKTNLPVLTAGARRRFEEHVLDAAGGLLSEAQKTGWTRRCADADPVTGFTGLKADPGKANLENILTAAKRLEFLRSLALPAGLLPGGGDAVSRSFRRRVANETPWGMRRHPAGRRHAIYALFLAHREREITDGLIDLLIETVHRITSQAKHTVVKRIAKEVEKVEGKERILVRIAEAASADPDGTVRDVVFPGGQPGHAVGDHPRVQGGGHVRAPGACRAARLLRRALPADAARGAVRPCRSTRTTRCTGR